MRNAQDTHATSNKFLGDAHGDAAGWAGTEKDFAKLVGVEGDAGVEHVGWDNKTDYEANSLGLKKTGGGYLPADAHANTVHKGLDDGRLGQGAGMQGRDQSDQLHQQVMASTGIKLSDRSGGAELRSTPTQRKQVAPGVALYTTKMEDSSTGKVLGMRYEGENSSKDSIEITVSIDGSRNLSYIGDGPSTSRSADIASGSRVLIGEVELNNPDDGYSLKVAVGLATKMVTVTRAAPKPKQQMPKLTVTQANQGGSRKQSVVSAEEREQRDKDLQYLFNKYEDSSEMGLPPGISSNGLTNFAKRCNLTDGKLTDSKVGLIFQSTKLAGKKKHDMNFERFQEATRKMAMDKNITYQELVQHAIAAEAMNEPMAGQNRGKDMVGAGGTHSNSVMYKGKKGTILDTADGEAVVQMEDNTIEMVPVAELKYVNPQTETVAGAGFTETRSQRFSVGKAQQVVMTTTTQQSVEKSNTITGE
jgi:hypothetical protein